MYCFHSMPLISLPPSLPPSSSLLLLSHSLCFLVKYVIDLFAGLWKLHTLNSPKSCNMLVLCNPVVLQTSNLCSNILESEVTCCLDTRLYHLHSFVWTRAMIDISSTCAWHSGSLLPRQNLYSVYIRHRN